jgi:hypothetical protein
VVDRDREPVPGAEVQVFFMRGPDVADEAARVIADDGGKYEAELPLLDRLSPVERATILVGAQATAPGCCPFGGVLDQPLGRREPGRLRLDVQAERGVRIRGRIVGPDQRPVRDACVRLIAEDPTLPPGRDQLTDDQGRYWVCAGRPGRYRVVASAFGLGFVSSDPVEAGAAKDVSLPDLALRGIGVIEGVATTSDGRPLPDLLVVAMPTWVWESRNARAHPWLLWGVRADEALHPGEGLTDGQVRSDAEGRFRIAGLRPGRYVLVALELDDLANPPVRLCQTGGRRDVVAGTHRLRIVVRDDSGRPIPGARLSFNGDRPSRDVRERSGTLTLPVRPGETIECIASVLGYQHAEAVFRVPEQPEDHRVELVLQGARPRGRLEVLLKDPDGAVIPEFLGHVYSRTGFSLVTVEGRPDREPRFTALPCGRFRLYLTPGREGRDFWLQLERDLELEPDVPTTVALVADRVGGRVHLRLVPPPDSIPGDTFDVQVDARRPGSVRPESGDRFESKAQIPRFRWLVNTAPKGQVESGEPGEVSLLLEPGAYDLRIRTDNHRTFERPITVVARQAQRIEVQLEQR